LSVMVAGSRLGLAEMVEFEGKDGTIEFEDDDSTTDVSEAVEKMGVRKVALMAVDRFPAGRMLMMSLAEMEVVERSAGVIEALVISSDVFVGPGGSTMLEDGVAPTAELEDSAGVGVNVDSTVDVSDSVSVGVDVLNLGPNKR
jgi:hypothetical protein